MREDLAISKNRVRKIGRGGHGLGHLLMRPREELVFVLVQCFVHQHHAELIVRHGCAASTLRLRHNLRSRSFGGLPVPELNSVLDHLPLACQAVSTILLVGLLEAFDRRAVHMAVQIIHRFLVCLLRLLTCGAIRFVLAGQQRHSTRRDQYDPRIPHTGPPLLKIRATKLPRLAMEANPTLYFNRWNNTAVLSSYTDCHPPFNLRIFASGESAGISTQSTCNLSKAPSHPGWTRTALK